MTAYKRIERTPPNVTHDITLSDLRGEWRIADGLHKVDGRPEVGALVLNLAPYGVPLSLEFAPGDPVTRAVLARIDAAIGADSTVTERPVPEPEPGETKRTRP